MTKCYCNKQINKVRKVIIFILGFLFASLYFVWSKGKVVASKNTLGCLVQVRKIPLPRDNFFDLPIPIPPEYYYLIEARSDYANTSTFRFYPSSDSIRSIQIVEIGIGEIKRFKVIFEGGGKIEVAFGSGDSLVEWRRGTRD